MTHATWHQQKIGNTSKYLLWYKSKAAKHQGTGDPSRFSGSKDAANTTINLTVTSLQPDDEAGYFCAQGEWGAAQGCSQTENLDKTLVFQQPVLRMTPVCVCLGATLLRAAVLGFN